MQTTKEYHRRRSPKRLHSLSSRVDNRGGATTSKPRPASVPPRKGYGKQPRRYRHLDISRIADREISGYSLDKGMYRSDWSTAEYRMLADKVYEANKKSEFFKEPKFGRSDDSGMVFHRLIEQSVELAEKHKVDVDLSYLHDGADMDDIDLVCFKEAPVSWNVGYNMVHLDFLPTLEKYNPEMAEAFMHMVKLLVDGGWSMFGDDKNDFFAMSEEWMDQRLWELEDAIDEGEEVDEDEIKGLKENIAWYKEGGIAYTYKSRILGLDTSYERAEELLKAVVPSHKKDFQIRRWIQKGLKAAKHRHWIPEYGCFLNFTEAREWDSVIYPSSMYGFIWSYLDASYDEQYINDSFGNNYLVENLDWNIIYLDGWEVKRNTSLDKAIEDTDEFLLHKGWVHMDAPYYEYPNCVRNLFS